MSISVQVLDDANRPVRQATVFVSWSSGGYSERQTDNSGIADLQTSSAGTAEYIQVNGKKVSGKIWLENGVQEVIYRR